MLKRIALILILFLMFACFFSALKFPINQQFNFPINYQFNHQFNQLTDLNSNASDYYILKLFAQKFYPQEFWTSKLYAQEKTFADADVYSNVHFNVASDDNFHNNSETDFSTDFDVILVNRNGQSVESYSGTVLEISGKNGLVFRHSDGKEETLSLESVYRLRPNQSDILNKADSVFVKGKRSGKASDFQKALELYRTARNTEKRLWVRQKITAQIVLCLTALGDEIGAVQEFFLLCSSDPLTPYLATAPLNWGQNRRFPDDPVQKRKESIAADWIKRNPDNVSGLFLTASLFLDGTAQQRDWATQKLKSLAAPQIPDDAFENLEFFSQRLALWSSAQLWRLQQITPLTDKDIENRIRIFERLPKEMQNGPALLIGDAFEKIDKKEDALWFFLRPALLSPEPTDLVRYSFEKSLELLQKMQKNAEAERLQAEFHRRFPAANSEPLKFQPLNPKQ